MNFRIKVNGIIDGKKINTLVGVSGLIKLVGIEMANKMIHRAFNGKGNKIEWADKMSEKCPEDGKELQCGTNLHWLFSQISASIECILQDL